MRYVIIGGVAGGASAAARLRRLDEKSEIIIIEKSNYISYANCGLPYYIGNVIKDESKLVLQTPLSFKRRFNIDVRTNEEVIEVNINLKKVVIQKNNSKDLYELSYDKLVISSGVSSKEIYKDVKNIFYLKTVEDTKLLYSTLNNNINKVLIIGGGYVGIEVAENIKHIGKDVTLIELNNHILSSIDEEMISEVEYYIRQKGINLRLNTKINKMSNTEFGKVKVECLNGYNDIFDMVIMTAGIKPNSSFLPDSISKNDNGYIKVNNMMETSIKDVYAIGDVIETYNSISGFNELSPLAGPANKQAVIVANNINGFNEKYKGSQQTSIIKIFDMAIGTTGLNEKQLIKNGIEYEKVIGYFSNHATYYPGSNFLTIKILFDKKTNIILGAQVKGFDGVDKRLDVLSTAIMCKMKANNLINLDLSYAPPFGSAKDPINMIGYISKNIIENKVEQFYWNDIDNIKNNDKSFILDVRTKEEQSDGTIDGSINIPLDELRNNLSSIPKDKKIYVYCYSGARSYIACRILNQHGFSTKNLSGGFRHYWFNNQD